MTAIRIQSRGCSLAADFHPAADPAPLAFVVVHGWASERPADIPAALAGAGYPALAYDLAGHAESEGDLDTLSRADWVTDVVAAIDVLREHVGPHTPIGLVGASFGSYLSIQATAHRPVACLSLRVPANYPDEGFADPHVPAREKLRLLEWMSAPLTPAENSTLAHLAAFTGRVHIVDADLDELIPPQAVLNYASVVPADRLTRHTLRGAPHNLADHPLRKEYIAELVAWAQACAAEPTR